MFSIGLFKQRKIIYTIEIIKLKIPLKNDISIDFSFSLEPYIYILMGVPLETLRFA